MTALDFDDVDSVLSAPGDLTVLDGEGETQPLTTYGTITTVQQIAICHELLSTPSVNNINKSLQNK